MQLSNSWCNLITSQLILKISRTVLLVCRVFSWLTSHNQIVNQVNIYFSAALHGKPLPVSLLTAPVSPNFTSSLLMLIFVHHLFGNSFMNFIALSLQEIQITDQDLIFIAEHHVYRHCGDVCNDVILMPWNNCEIKLAPSSGERIVKIRCFDKIIITRGWHIFGTQYKMSICTLHRIILQHIEHNTNSNLPTNS